MGLETATLALIASAAGSAIAAAGAVQQGQAANAQSRFQAQVLQQQADRDQEIAKINADDFRRQQSGVAAAGRAAAGGKGVTSGTGSSLLVAEDFAAESELAALRIRAGGDTSALRLRQQAGLVRQQGRSLRTAGFVRGGSLLLTGAGKTFSDLDRFSSGPKKFSSPSKRF